MFSFCGILPFDNLVLIAALICNVREQSYRICDIEYNYNELVKTND